MKGETKSGFKSDVNEAVIDDWETMKAIADMDSGDASRVLQGTVKFVNMVLGDEETALVEHIRSKNKGACSQESMFNEVMEIIDSIKEIKNSQSSQGS